jgi:chromosome segregation ATPase
VPASLAEALAELARARVDLESLLFKNRLAESQFQRLRQEFADHDRRANDERNELKERVRRIEAEHLALETHVNHLQTTLEGIYASKSWRVVRALRRLVGRRW